MSLAEYRRALPPATILATVALTKLMAGLGVLPSTANLLERVAVLARSADPVVVSGLSLLESVAGLNVYFPGSVAILVVMASTAGQPLRGFITFAAIVIGSFVGQNVNYFVGRWSAPTFRTRVGRTADIVGGLLTYWHPQLGSVFSVQRGAEQLSYGAFVVVLVSSWLPWNLFWGVLMYSVGGIPASGEEWELVLIVYSVGWLVIELSRSVRLSRP